MARTTLASRLLYPNTSHASHLFHLSTNWATIPPNPLPFLDGDAFLYEYFCFICFVNIYYFPTATLFFQSPRMPISSCDINFASHDEVLLNGHTG